MGGAGSNLSWIVASVSESVLPESVLPQIVGVEMACGACSFTRALQAWHNDVLFDDLYGAIKIFYLIYVDNIRVMCNDSAKIDCLIKELQRQLAVKNLGGLSYFLSIEARWNTGSLFLLQNKYVHDLLEKAQMTSCAFVSTPYTVSEKLTVNGGKTFPDSIGYLSVIGGLQYLKFT
ncbi:hypothetical protein GH714_034700 [Hevea brasiliensis]|uniref:Reverse transcriptase Ty1/copia-type domain-containing protein n=1 Tax=Hevea brasiliensis TaxID=3981 RepID=A0A6A6K864_HEVBR|nr:hypothetical protein GH714_034700 [Hevea brasiliensis]